eukprot:GDKI01024605.1.p1 GENE.GDKI01024605.1~~GDKI01024605.1.p1  ORF type:complete len:503 (-),score=177.44 GDKI01024605.1:34-1401(-)
MAAGRVLVAACLDELKREETQQEERVKEYTQKLEQLCAYVCGCKSKFEERRERHESNKCVRKGKMEEILKTIRGLITNLECIMEEERKDSMDVEESRVKLEQAETHATHIQNTLTSLQHAHTQAATRWYNGQEVATAIGDLSEMVCVRARTHLLESCEGMLKDAPVDAHKCKGFLQQVYHELDKLRIVKERSIASTHKKMECAADELQTLYELGDPAELDAIPEDDAVAGEANAPRAGEGSAYKRTEARLEALRNSYNKQVGEHARLKDCIAMVEHRQNILVQKESALQRLMEKEGSNIVLLQKEKGAIEFPPFSETEGVDWAKEFFFTIINPLRVAVPPLALHTPNRSSSMVASFRLGSEADEQSEYGFNESQIGTEASELIGAGDWHHLQSSIRLLTGQAGHGTPASSSASVNPLTTSFIVLEPANTVMTGAASASGAGVAGGVGCVGEEENK